MIILWLIYGKLSYGSRCTNVIGQKDEACVFLSVCLWCPFCKMIVSLWSVVLSLIIGRGSSSESVFSQWNLFARITKANIDIALLSFIEKQRWKMSYLREFTGSIHNWCTAMDKLYLRQTNVVFLIRQNAQILYSFK